MSLVPSIPRKQARRLHTRDWALLVGVVGLVATVWVLVGLGVWHLIVVLSAGMLVLVGAAIMLAVVGGCLVLWWIANSD